MVEILAKLHAEHLLSLRLRPKLLKRLLIVFELFFFDNVKLIFIEDVGFLFLLPLLFKEVFVIHLFIRRLVLHVLGNNRFNIRVVRYI